MKIIQEKVFGADRDYSRANRALLFITLSTMQHDTMEKGIKSYSDSGIMAFGFVNIMTQTVWNNVRKLTLYKCGFYL